MIALSSRVRSLFITSDELLNLLRVRMTVFDTFVTHEGLGHGVP